MAQHPPDGKRDHATHAQRRHDEHLRALHDILTLLAHGVARRIHDQHRPPHHAAAQDDAEARQRPHDDTP